MSTRDERSEDVVENCDILLDKLSHCSQTDSTPEGRMISQLKWLKEKAQAGNLEFPVDRRYIATLSYVFTEGSLHRLVASREEYAKAIEIYLYRLMVLTRDGSFLAKPEYYPYAVRCVNKLIGILKNAQRSLSARTIQIFGKFTHRGTAPLMIYRRGKR